MANTTRALIIAHSSAVRAGLRAMLESPDLIVIAEVSNLGDPFAFEIDVIVSDDMLPEHSNLNSPALVLLSDLEQPPPRLLEARGWALVPSDASASELRAAVIASAQGLAVLPAHLAAPLIVLEPEPALARTELGDTLESFNLPEALTARERDVLEWLALGYSNKRIAKQLEIAESTVKFHIAAIYAKFNVSGRVEAVNIAARRGLIAL
jgi:two-component system, NarL family, nitrate/nitrite response regulator NarL